MIKLPDFVVVRFGLIAAVTMKIAVIMLCNLVEVDYMFVFRCVSRERKERLLDSTCLFVRLHAWNKSAVTGRVFVTLILGFSRKFGGYHVCQGYQCSCVSYGYHSASSICRGGSFFLRRYSLDRIIRYLAISF
jgi:hypothetical protein